MFNCHEHEKQTWNTRKERKDRKTIGDIYALCVEHKPKNRERIQKKRVKKNQTNGLAHS